MGTEEAVGTCGCRHCVFLLDGPFSSATHLELRKWFFQIYSAVSHFTISYETMPPF